jgi:phospholipase A1/A2
MEPWGHNLKTVRSEQSIVHGRHRRALSAVLLALIAGLAAAGHAADPPAPGAAPAQALKDADDLFVLGQDYLNNLGAYQPMYFLFGSSLARSKFQLSFRYRFFNPSAPLAVKHPWVTGMHFGFTQTSFWDLQSDSKPFEDTSYKPEFFYLSRNITWKPRAVDALFIKAGVQHESNGRDGVTSRSTNWVYVAPILLFRLADGKSGLAIQPRIKYYFNNNDGTNPDFADYRGRAEIAIDFGRANSFVVKSNIGFAKRGTSLTVDATYPLSRSWFQNLQIYLYVQYVNALAENLINYRERTRALRIGISFIR